MDSTNAIKAKKSFESYLTSLEVVEALSSKSVSLHDAYIGFLTSLGLGQSLA